MAVTGGGGDPARARVIRAAVKRKASGKALAHGYIKTPATPNFGGHSQVTPAQSKMAAARQTAKKAVANGGYGTAIANPRAAVKSVPKGGAVGQVNRAVSGIRLPRVDLSSLMPRTRAANPGTIQPRKVTTGGEGIGAGYKSYSDLQNFLKGR